MSNQVVKSVPDHNPTQALLDLERFDHCSDVTTPFSFFHGPFGVSRLSQVVETDFPDLITEETTPSPSDWPAELDEILGQEEETDLFPSLLDVSNDRPVDESWLLELIPSEIEPIEVVSDSPRSQIASHPSLFNDNHEAWAVLSHYKDRVVHLISPLGHGQEGAWLSLVMPYAVNTLGELTMSGSANNARLALLNALLSTSAFHLGQNSVMQIDHWITLGNSYLQKAECHFMTCVEENCISGVKKNKYKEILMAILSLSTAYVCHSLPPVFHIDGNAKLTNDFQMADVKWRLRQASIMPSTSREIHLHQRIRKVNNLSETKVSPSLLRIHAHHGRDYMHRRWIERKACQY